MRDPGTTIFLLRIVRTVLEIALFALVGQGIVWVLIRAMGQQDPQSNFFYRTLATIVMPFTWLVRKITPAFVADRHIPFAVLALLVVGYAWTLFAFANACIAQGLTIAECRQVR
jgi:hypothetical protein